VRQSSFVAAGGDFSGAAASVAAQRQSTTAPDTSFTGRSSRVRLRERTKAGQLLQPTGP